MKNILIIGMGPSGVSAAEATLSSNYKITIIGEEDYLPYYRPRLSKMIGENITVNDILIKKESWFLENNISLIKNNKVNLIDFKEKKVILNDKTNISYDKLIIATGAKSFVPDYCIGSNYSVLRTYDDLLKIKEKAKNYNKVSILGGGILGLEIAWELCKIGINVQIIEKHNHMLPRQLDKNASDFLSKKVLEKGIELLFGKEPQKAFCDLKKDSFVIVAAGAVPSIPAFEGGELKINKGIIVDNYMQTSLKDVYACGDVCEFNNKSWGLILVAIMQGKIAGKNAIDEKTEYLEAIPASMASVAGYDIFSTGNISSENAKMINLVNDDFYRSLFIEENKIIGSILIGNTTNSIKIKNLILNKSEINNEIIEKILNGSNF